MHRKISLCVATSLAPVMESSTEQANSGIELRLLPIAARALYGEVPHERAAVRCLLHNANRSIGVRRGPQGVNCDLLPLIWF